MDRDQERAALIESRTENEALGLRLVVAAGDRRLAELDLEDDDPTAAIDRLGPVIACYTEHRSWEDVVDCLTLRGLAYGADGQLDRMVEDVLDAAETADFRVGDPDFARELLVDTVEDLVTEGCSDLADRVLGRLAERHGQTAVGAAVHDGATALVDFHRGRGPQAWAAWERAYQALVEQEEWVLAAKLCHDGALMTVDGKDYAHGLDLLNRAVEHYDRAECADEAAECQGGIGQFHLERGEHAESAAAYRSAAERYAALQNTALQAVQLYNVGEALVRQGDNAGAIEAWLQAAEVTPDRGVAADAWTRAAEAYRELGDVDAAEEAIERALQAARRPQDDDRPIDSGDDDHSLHARWQQLAFQLETDPASVDPADVRQLRSEFLNRHNRSDAASCDLMLADLEYRAGRRSEADALWDSAADVFTQLRELHMVAQVHDQRAYRAAQDHNPDLAEKHFRLARDLYREANRPAEAERCEMNLAGIRVQRGELGEIDIPKPGPNPITTRTGAHTQLGFARIEVNLGRFREAAHRAQKALDYFESHRYRAEADETRVVLAAAEDGLGDQQRVAELLNEVAQQPSGPATDRNRATAAATLAFSYLRRGELKLARESLTSAIDIFESIGDHGPAAMARFNLGVIEVHGDDPERGLRLLAAASAWLRAAGMVAFAARADIASAVGLTRMGNHAMAMNVGAPAMIVFELLRAGMNSAKDRNDWRTVTTWAHDIVMDVAVKIDDPAMTAELVERLRAGGLARRDAAAESPTGTDEAGMPAAATMIDVSAAIGTPAVVLHSELSPWTAGGSLLADSERMPLGPPPLITMPWGTALGDHEARAERLAAPLSQHHLRDRQTVNWQDQIGFR